MGQRAGKQTFIALVGIQLAAIILSPFSVLWKLVGLAIWYLAWFLIFKNYCSGCPGCKEGCTHGFPGALAKRLFGYRKIRKYTRTDYTGLIMGVALLVLTPALLLATVPVWLTVYGVGSALVGTVIIRKVCPFCCNELCPLNPLRRISP